MSHALKRKLGYDDLAGLRLENGDYRMAAVAQGSEPLVHPDWPELTIDLAALWR